MNCLFFFRLGSGLGESLEKLKLSSTFWGITRRTSQVTLSTGLCPQCDSITFGVIIVS